MGKARSSKRPSASAYAKKAPAPKKLKALPPPPTKQPKPSYYEIVEAKVAKHKFQQERAFPPHKSYKFYKLAQDLGLQKLLDPRKAGNVAFVRHFYFYVYCFKTTTVNFHAEIPQGKPSITVE